MSEITKKEEVSSLPEGFKSEKNVATKVTSLKKKIEDFLLNLKDRATAEIYMDVDTRMKDRLKSIKDENSANHIKIKRDANDRGFWKTIPPKLHIRNLRGITSNNQLAEIRFEVFEMDDEGNKKLYTKKTKVQLADGSMMDREVTADYRIAYEVVETIEYKKDIKREVIKYDLVEGEN